jgi:adenylate kinase
MHVVLLGPPGVGKGTQGRRLATDRGWALVSTGEMLRDAAARGTPMGREAGRVMNSGHLVPDDVMIGLVRERLREPDATAGWVLDGFPRTVPQAEALDALLAEQGSAVDVALALVAPAEELVSRLASRRECPVCKRSYNLVSAPPRSDERCDDHPDVTLVRRADDEESTVKQRLEVYEKQTAPLLNYYETRGRRVNVPGVGKRDQVYATLKRALANGAGGR